MKMQDLHVVGRASDISSHHHQYRNRELLEAVLQKKDGEPNKSETGSRISALISRQNGNLSRPSSFSRRSLNLSRQSLTETQSHDTDSDLFNEERCYAGTEKSIFSLGLLSLAALVLVGLSMQLLFVLYQDQNAIQMGHVYLFNSTRNYDDLLEVTTALTTLVLMLNACCLMVCAMQCFFASKILNVNQGDQRAFKYLRECSSSRFIAVTGFFVSIPTFLVVIVMYVLMKFKSSPALVSTVVLGLGILFCVLSVMQNTYHWRLEKSRADGGLPVFERSKNNVEISNPRNELSTLV